MEIVLVKTVPRWTFKSTRKGGAPTPVLTGGTAAPSVVVLPGPKGLDGSIAPKIGFAGEPISALKVVSSLFGHLYVSDPSDRDLARCVVGLALTAGDEDAAIQIHSAGMLSDSSWSWTPGQAVFCGATGELTTTPHSGHVIRVGAAVSPTTIFVNLQPAIERL